MSVADATTAGKGARWAKAAALLALAFLVSCMLSGCILPDRIMQKIYEDNEQYPVDNTVAPVLVNDPDAEKTSELLPKISQQDDADRKDETIEAEPEYDEQQENTEQPVSTPVASDTETSQAGTSQAGDKTTPNSSTKKTPSKSGEKAPTGEDSDDPVEDPDGGQTQEEEEEEEGETPNEEQKGDDDDPTDENSARDVTREADEYVISVGDEAQDIPENIARIAAVGDAATIVAMLGGSAEGCPLVAADQAFIEANSSLLADRGVSRDAVAPLWAQDGATEATLDDEAFKRLTDEVKPDMVLYPTSVDCLSDAQIVALKDAGVPVWSVDLRTSANIVAAVITIGETLQQGGNAFAGQRSADYMEFYNAIVDGIGDAASGARKYTLYISDWDPSARFGNADFDSSHGVGIAQLGSKASPLVYYLEKAGIANTAASGPKYSNATPNRASVVWQLKSNYAANKYENFTSLDKSKATFDLTGGSGFDNALLYSAEGGAFTSAFPGLIVATQQIRDDYLLPDMSLSNGLYHPFGSVDAGSLGTVVGYKPGSTTYESAIGFVSGQTTSTLYDGAGVLSAEYVDHVYVNPHGLYSSWADGSVESVLEVCWAYATVNRGGDRNSDIGIAAGGASTPAGMVAAFYEKFYGYPLSDAELSVIFAGLAE